MILTNDYCDEHGFYNGWSQMFDIAEHFWNLSSISFLREEDFFLRLINFYKLCNFCSGFYRSVVGTFSKHLWKTPIKIFRNKKTLFKYCRMYAIKPWIYGYFSNFLCNMFYMQPSRRILCENSSLLPFQ